MTPGNGGRRRQARRGGAHRKTRQRRPILTRTVAAGAAFVCIGAAYEATAPTVHALAIVFRNPDGNGGTNETRINILQGNIFDPQLAILGNNVSDNSSTAGGTVSIGKNPLVDNLIFNNPITQLINRLWNQEIVFGPAAAGPINNTTQISVGSFNIFNPQASIFGGNVSNNTTSGNVAIGNGNQTVAAVKSIAGLWTSWLGGMTGNGNTLQVALFSGNIFNPQWSLLGSNTSSNTATTNVADNNGNDSQTKATSGGLLGAVVHTWGSFLLGGMTGNGNTNQTAVGTSNVYNPQGSIGGQNQSSNTAVTNEAVGNGNQSTTTVSPASGSGNTVVVGTTGNGNTTQTASGAGNIDNTQVSIGSVHKTTVTKPATKTAGSTAAGTNATSSTSVTSAQSTASSSSTLTPTGSPAPSTAQTPSHTSVSGTPAGSTGSAGSSSASAGSNGSGGSAK